MDVEMYVTKRSGEIAPIAFDKIQTRIRRLLNLPVKGESVTETAVNGKLSGFPTLRPLTRVKCSELTMKIIDQIHDKITTTKLDELTAEQCASMSSSHPDYGDLASRVIVSNHHKNTSGSFLDVTRMLYENKYNGKQASLISQQYYDTVQWYASLSMQKDAPNFWVNVKLPGTRGDTVVKFSTIDDVCNYDRDYLLDFFGFKTLENAYLLKTFSELGNKVVRERPQHLWLRVAIGIHGRNVTRVLKTYTYLSTKMFTHATPTLFNAGTTCPQLSSCFLLQMESDSITGIYNTLSACAKISQYAGGIGVSAHNIRAAGSAIRGTGGTSNGLVPMLKVFESTALYVDQGGGKRNGSFAIYLEPWHADVEAFIQMKMNHGADKMRARNLFYALWIPDLFMERVRDNKPWTLMCPDRCPGLDEVYGEKFVELYERYESEGKGMSVISARTLFTKIMDAQMETGTPYLLYKDAINRNSNQMNVGVIKSSNLCCEITEFTSPDESAVCNLASIALPSCIVFDEEMHCNVFDFEKLAHVAGVITENLDTVIDVNFYPVEINRKSNMRHRPIGIGVQGLADVFLLLNMAFDSPDAKELNRQIFETIYFGALTKSAELAELHGPYDTFAGSPASQGKLQFDLQGKVDVCSPKLNYNWTDLKEKICVTGLRNSLLVSLMPTASTSQILGFNECIEPITSNIYSRSTLAGDFIVTNKYLINELINMNLWSETIKNSIIAHQGSIQHLTEIPEDVRRKYRTVWELSMRDLIDMAVDRGSFVCQSQSMNLWVANPTYKILYAMHMYGWSKGLKTGIYYLRRQPRYNAQQFIIEPTNNNEKNTPNSDICEMCSS